MKRHLLALALTPFFALPAARAQSAPKENITNEEQPTEEKEEKKAASKFRETGKDKYGKFVPAVLQAYAPLCTTARLSTVQVLSEGAPIAYACVVHEKGYLLTKASEVEKAKSLEVIFAKSEAFPNGLRMSAEISDRHEEYDLAILKTSAAGFRAMQWETGTEPKLGSMLAAPGLGELPLSFGVASVAVRNLDDRKKGFLGVLPETTEKGLVLRRVNPGSAADRAGLKVDDIVLSINGKEVKTVSEFVTTIASCKPDEVMKLKIIRGEEEKDIDAILDRRAGNVPQQGEDPRNAMSGRLSTQRAGFPNALQHDLILKPEECGGPLVDIEGRVVGINIARSGRIECFAIPSLVIVELMQKIETGKFNRPDLDEKVKQRESAEARLKAMMAQADLIKKEIDELNAVIERIRGKRPEPEVKKEEAPKTDAPKEPAEKK